MGEKIKIDFLPEIDYNNTPQNVIGASTNASLRTVTSYSNSNCKHVRKFGIDLAAADITNAVIEHPRSAGGNAWTFDFQGWNGSAWVSMGSVKDTGGASAAFTDGDEFTATKVRIVITPDSGDTISITDGDHITLTVDGATINVMLPGESMTAAFTLYLSATGSTYYDTALMYGGKRHTPDGTAALPYFSITAALAALGGAFTIVTVLDSATYDEELTISGAYTLQAALGQTPTITSGVGARVTREVAHDGNNSDTVYVAKTGNDGTGTGTWWAPYLTIGAAFAAIGARGYINVMDSGIYDEAVDISSNCIIEPIYAMIPTWQKSSSNDYVVNLGGATCGIHGFILDGVLSVKRIISIQVDGYTGTISDNSMSRTRLSTDYYLCGIVFNAAGSASQVFKGTIAKNIIYDCRVHGIAINFMGTTKQEGLINKNIVYNCGLDTAQTFTSGIYLNGAGEAGTFDTITILTNNIIYACSNATSTWSGGIMLASAAGSATMNHVIDNNTVYNCAGRGFHYASGRPYTGSFHNNIFSGSGVYDVARYTLGSITMTYSRYGTNGGGDSNNQAITIGTGCITTTPSFMSSVDPYNFALAIGSACYRTGSAEDDMGAVFGNILIASSTVEINGFIFDGQSQSNNAIYKTGASDYTALSVKWCSIYNYQGSAIDDYSGATTSSSITNCKIYNNGNGIKFKRGGNTVEGCLIYNNTSYGIHADYTVYDIDHCVFYGNAYGIYLKSNSASIILKNSIFYNNSVYAIYSDAIISVTYCDVVDAVSALVDVSSETNFSQSPLFVDTDDFHIKTRELGYSIQSPCYGSADDGSDMGAYVVTRGISDYFMDTYTLAFNPRQISFANEGKGVNSFENILGDVSVFAKSLRRRFTFQYPSGQYSDTSDRKMLEYLSSLVRTRENTLTQSRMIMRLHFVPASFIIAATNITSVDVTLKKITDSTATWKPNEHRGFYASVQFAYGTGAVVSASAKTATVSGASWTTDQWVGYYYYLGGYYYYIKSNNATVLTLSDKYATLEDGTYAYNIEKYFKIIENGSNYLIVRDDDDELTAAAVRYYIDFICVKAVKPSFSWKQSMFDFTREANKNGYEVTFEEV